IFVGMKIQILLTENEKHRYEDGIHAKEEMLLFMKNEIHRCNVR
ncbi:10602_t:CDS:1, partial [Gigaspora rosea]